MERNYAAFISYRHAPLDSAAAKKLHSLIEQFSIPPALRRDGKARFGLVFRDEEELAASGDLSGEICRALDNSRFLIVVCSTSTADSPWVGREIEHFLRSHDRSRVFALLVEGEPENVFPAALTRFTDADGNEHRLEPLAVDARADSIAAMKKALRREVPRLCAAMLGCAYDELVQRTLRRKRRRVTAILAAVLAVALGFSGVLLAKNREIDLKNQELEEKNLLLTEQKREILLRESEILTQNALEALAEGDYAKAIESAVAALPSSENDRPYYAEAEAALISALDLVGEREENHIITATEIHQLSAVEDFTFSPDGSILISVDAFGCLRAFAADSGESLWEASIPAGYAAADYSKRFPLLCADGRVTAYYGGTLAAFELQSGEMIWSVEHLQLEDGALCLSPDGSTLACLAREIDIATGSHSHSLLSIDAADGSISAALALPYSDTTLLSSAVLSFSHDGKTVAGSCILPLGDGTYSINHYLAKPQNGSISGIWQSESLLYSGDVKLLRFSKDDSALYALRSTAEGGMVLEKFDPATGERLWISDSANPSAVGSSFGLILTPGRAYFHLGETLSCLDLESGSILWQHSFAAAIMSLEIVQDSFFGYVLADGSHGLGWKNAAGFFSSERYGAEAKLGELSAAKTHGGGMVRAEVEDGSILSMSIAADGDGGAVALMGPRSDSSILIKSSRSILGIGGERSGESLSGNLYEAVAETVGGYLVLGPVKEGEESRIEFFSADSLESAFSLPVDALARGEDIRILPHGGFILDDGSGGISLVTAEGETPLSRRETVTLSTGESYAFMDSLCLSESVKQADGSILSLLCSEKELILWTDGGDERAIALPGGLIWQLSDGTAYRRSLSLSEDGYALLTYFADESDSLSDGFALCRLSDGSWELIPDEGSGDTDRLIAMGRGGSFALMESDGLLRLYEKGEGGYVSRTVDTGLPLSSIESMEFVPDADVLMLRSADHRLLFLSAGDGEELLRLSLSSAEGRPVAYSDTEGSRLYVAMPGTDPRRSTGLCIDTSSWTPIAEIPGMLCYEVGRNEVFLISDRSLSAMSIPHTAELVEIGKSLVK